MIIIIINECIGMLFPMISTLSFTTCTFLLPTTNNQSPTKRSHAAAGLATCAASFIKSPKYVEALVRYSLTLVHLHYLVLDDDLSSADWAYLLRGQLLTPAEVGRL